MYTYKVVVTVFDAIMMLILLYFMNGLTWDKNKASIIGFLTMQILFMMNILGMWKQ